MEVKMEKFEPTPIHEVYEEETETKPSRKTIILIVLAFFVCLIPGVVLWILCGPESFIERFLTTLAGIGFYIYVSREIGLALKRTS